MMESPRRPDFGGASRCSTPAAQINSKILIALGIAAPIYPIDKEASLCFSIDVYLNATGHKNADQSFIW